MNTLSCFFLPPPDIEVIESGRRYEVQKEDVWTLYEFTNAWSQRYVDLV